MSRRSSLVISIIYKSNLFTTTQWHLGNSHWSMTPTFRGFNSHYGYLMGASDYWKHINAGVHAGVSYSER